jgi:putative hydrolase
MIAVDFHTHSLFSRCGLHTVMELLERARILGMKGFAVTDHGLMLGGRLNSVFFERFISPYPEITVLKGIECNVLDKSGAIDLPGEYLQWIDIVLTGLHHNTEKKMSEGACTALLVNALRKNSAIDLITHPNDPGYPVDFQVLAREASERGVALELNNSKIHYNRSSEQEAIRMLEACRENRCSIAVCSDTHAIHELGDDGAIAPLLAQVDFPGELIVNRNATAAFEFIEKRRGNKRLLPPA